MNENLRTAIVAALEAGRAILEIYNSGDFEVAFKCDNSPLTKADTLSHDIIVSYLCKTNIQILSEEGGAVLYEDRKDWSQLWVVDPLDGTKEFVKRNGEFTVNIALIENKKPILGVVFAPVLNTLYFSTKEMGSYKVSLGLEGCDVEMLLLKAEKLPLYRKSETFTLITSRSHMSEETEIYINEIREKKGRVNLMFKGSSLKFCLVAEGQADCYPRFAPTMEWDTAAGQAICEYAGFNVIDWSTKERMLYNREKLLNNWFVVGGDCYFI